MTITSVPYGICTDGTTRCPPTVDGRGGSCAEDLVVGGRPEGFIILGEERIDAML